MPKFCFGDEIDGGDSEARGQHAVIGRRRAAALDVAEHADANFFVRTEPMASPTVLPTGQPRAICLSSGGSLMPSATTTMVKRLPYAFALLQRIRRCFSMVKGISGMRMTWAPPAMPASSAIQPAVAAHDFDHHDAMVRFGGGVDLVDGVGGGVQGGIEAESDVRWRERSLSMVLGTPTVFMPF